jgi:hypothetical protein
MHHFTVLFSLSLLLVCCGGADEEAAGQSTAVAVIDRAVTAHGMEGLERLSASFRFRDIDYGIEMDDGQFSYTRAFTDSLGRSVRDELTNRGLRRRLDGEVARLSPKDSSAYAESVNSVRYFFLLPYGLHDPAVMAELLEPATIRGQPYDRVRVTFAEEGGGTDHDDVYHYFFNRESGELDYLAYSFEANEGGIRFREATNKRRVAGVLVQDYINYGTNGADRDLSDIGRRFETGELPELSRITNAGVRIDRVGDR